MKKRRSKFIFSSAKRRSHRRRQASAAALGLLSALGAVFSASAATETWSGTASGVWDTSALNWNSGAATWTSSNDALFSGTPTNNVTTATGLTIGNITLDNTFTGSVTLTGTNTMAATTTTTINGGTLNLNATGGLGGSVVVIGTAGTVNVTANGAISNIFTGTGTINATNTANTPNFNNTASLGGFTGTFNVNTSGTQKVQLSGTAATIGSGATINVGSAGTLYVSGAGGSFNGITFNLAGLGNTEALGALRLDGNTVIGSTSSIVLGGSASTTTQLGGNTGTSVINAVISESVGTRSVEKVGSGTTIFGANNTYTGATILTGGTLSVSTDSAGAYNLGGSGTNGITFNGGTLQVTGTTMTSFGSHTPTFTATKTVGLDINNAANTFTVSQALNQTTGGLTKAGLGTLTLTGANTYTGTTTIQGGTLNVGDGTSGVLGTGALTFNTNGGTVNFSEAAGSSQSVGALTFGGGAATVKLTYGGSGTSTLTFASLAARTAGATGNFVSSGGVNGTSNIIKFTSAPTAGALIDRGEFFNGSSYATYDSGGFVRAYGSGDTNYVAASSSIASASTSNVALTGNITSQASASINTLNMGANTLALGSGAAFQTNGILVSGNSAATISGGTSLAATTSGAEIVVRVDGSSDALDISTPIIANGANAFTKTGAGTLTLSGTGNAYTGATTVDEGTLSLSGTLTGNTAITIKPGATFSETSTGVISGSSALTSSGTTTLAGVNTNTGLTTVSGGTLTVTGSGKISGSTANLALSGGTLDLGTTSQSVAATTISAAATSGNTIQNGNLTGTGTLTVSNTIGNAIVTANYTGTSLSQTGAGTLTLSGTNAFNNNITVGAGNLAITGGTTTVDGGAANNLGFVNVSGGGSVTVSGGSLSILGSTGTKPGSFIGQNSSGTVTVSGGSFTVGGNANFGVGNNNYGAVGTLNINSGTATITAGSAVLQNTQNFIALGRDNATGIINLNGGTLATGRQFLRDGANGGKQGAGTAIFNFNGGTLQAQANQTSGNGWFETATTGDYQVVTTTVKSGGAKIDTNNFNVNINTVLAHDSTLGGTADGGLTKSGTGTLSLGAANTYTGATTLNAGTLTLTSTGSISSSASLTIAAGATFDVSAKTSYSLSSSQPLTLSLDASTIGTINSGSVAVDLANAALTLNITTATPGASYDFLNSSALSSSGNFGSVALTGSSFSGSLTQSGSTWTGTSNGYNFSLDQTSGALTITAVPEPHEFALAIVGLLGVLVFIRRRNQQV